MARSGDDSDLNFTKAEFGIILKLKELEISILSLWFGSHNDRHLELSVSWDEVSMIMSE